MRLLKAIAKIVTNSFSLFFPFFLLARSQLKGNCDWRSNETESKRQMKFNAREKLPPPFGLMEQSVRKSSHFSFPFPIHRRKSSPSELHFERLESILRGKSNNGESSRGSVETLFMYCKLCSSTLKRVGEAFKAHRAGMHYATVWGCSGVTFGQKLFQLNLLF